MKRTFPRSVATTVNISFAKLLNTTHPVSEADLAGQFLEILSEESNSIAPNNPLCHVSSLLNEYPTLPRCFGFLLSRYSCPRETQLVISLSKGLLLRITEVCGYFPSLGREFNERNSLLQAKVCVLCFAMLPF